MFRQAAEKALKAVQFADDANHATIKGHNLNLLARITNDQTLKDTASLLEGVVGSSSQLRYPDNLQYPRIPHDIYTKEKAGQALQYAREIVQKVKELIRSKW